MTGLVSVHPNLCKLPSYDACSPEKGPNPPRHLLSQYKICGLILGGRGCRDRKTSGFGTLGGEETGREGVVGSRT